MPADLLTHENHELARLKRELNELAARFPSAMVETDDGGSVIADPHLMAFLKANARMIAGARHQFETEWSEVMRRTLEYVAPHYAAVIPPMAIVQFDPPRGKPVTSIPVGYPLRPAGNVAGKAEGIEDCLFQVRYPLSLLPVEVTAATYRNSVPRRYELSALRNPSSPGIAAWSGARTSFEIALGPMEKHWHQETVAHLQRVRIHLACNDDSLSFRLHEALFQHAVGVFVTSGEREWIAGRHAPVGFRNAELVLPPGRTVASRQQLLEYFCIPKKFLFVDFVLPREALKNLSSDSPLKILVLFDRDLPELEAVAARDLLLNCAPVVNLFQTAAQPIRITAEQMDYPVVVDQRKSEHIEVYSIDRVQEVHADNGKVVECPRHFGGRYRYGAERAQYAWHATVGESDQPGMQLRLWDESFAPDRPTGTIRLDFRVTCSNRDLATTIRPGQRLLGQSGESLTARVLTRPTATLRPPAPRNVEHHLQLHLAEPRLSFIDRESSPGHLQSALHLYSLRNWLIHPTFGKSDIRQQVAERCIAGIVAVSSRTSLGGSQRIHIELEETALSYETTWLFGALLRRFLGSFSPLGAKPKVVVRNSTQFLRPWRVARSGLASAQPLNEIENVTNKS